VPLLAVNITLATPPAVVAEVAESDPMAVVPTVEEGLKEKVTVVPSGTLSVAVMEAMPWVLMDVGLAEMVMPEPPPVPVTGAPALLLLTLDGEQPIPSPSRMSSTPISK